MRHFRRSALVARTPELVYGVVADVERYPEFVPGCRAARIDARGDGELVATLDVARGPLVTRFTTRNRLDPPHTILMRLERGPFRRLEGRWSFVAVGEQGCRIELALSFEFSALFPAPLFDPLFEDLAAALVDAFVARARASTGDAALSIAAPPQSTADAAPRSDT